VATLGWIGLGDIGAPMASRLAAAGHELLVWARNPARCEPLVAAGASVVASPRELGARCEAVFTCVTDGAAVEAVVLGDDGVAAGATRASLIVDHSTIHPDDARRIALRLAERGIAAVDAPVSGGHGGAVAGTLACFLGGDAAAAERARTFATAYAQNITYFGPAGCGQIAKSCNQAVVISTIALWAEMLAYARRNGLDATLLVDALAGGWADSAIRSAHGPALATGEYTPLAGNLLLKDLEIVGDLARESASPMPVTSAVTTLYRLLAARGYPTGGARAIVQLFRDSSDSKESDG
jgi:3-hydroxyisobutyrate dehydrogenase-like beta-hydroxyacid dehydrogenase